MHFVKTFFYDKFQNVIPLVFQVVRSECNLPYGGPKDKMVQVHKGHAVITPRLHKSERDFIYITMESSIEINGIPNHLLAITYF